MYITIVITVDLELDRLGSCSEDTVMWVFKKLVKTGQPETYWSQKGKASSRSLPNPAKFFFCGMARGLAIAPRRRPVPCPPQPWAARKE